MDVRIKRAGLLALHQTTVALGILFLPVALAARRAGLRLPIGRLVEATGSAYEQVTEET